MNKYFSILFLFCSLYIISCKKENKQGSDGNDLNILKTEKGVVTGPCTSKIIGIDGGQIISNDGKVRISIGQGTVSVPTEFCIQPVTNTLYEEISGKIAYRLLPDTTFEKLIAVEFFYGPEDLRNTSEDVLRMAFQQPDGSWKLVPTGLNKTNKTLVINTDHFSDWTVTADLFLKANKTDLFPGESTDLLVIGVADEDDLLAPLIPSMQGKITSIKNWNIVDGPGVLSSIGGSENFVASNKYLATENVTQNENVTVQVEVNGNIIIPDPYLPMGRRRFSKVILLEGLTVSPDGFLSGSFNGTPFLFSGSQVVAGEFLGNILITAMDANFKLDLSAIGTTAGFYPCGNINSPGKSWITRSAVQGGEGHASVYLECNTGAPKYTNSSLEITKWPAVGEYAEGKFSGSLFISNNGQCGPFPVPINLNFRVKRTI